MAEYVPESPISVASSDTCPWSPSFVEEEGVLVPYWDLIHEFSCREDEFCESFPSDEQRLRDFWYNQHLIQRD